MSKADEARRKAQELLSRTHEEERLEGREKQRQEEDAKIARLRALRLAKEAEDEAARDAATPHLWPKGARPSGAP